MKIDFSQLEFIDPMLREILAFIEKLPVDERTITSLYRIDDNGVHGTLPLRGADIRCRDRSEGEAIEEAVIAEFFYDPAPHRSRKKCAFLHGEGSNLHLHLQVHPNTRRRTMS